MKHIILLTINFCLLSLFTGCANNLKQANSDSIDEHYPTHEQIVAACAPDEQPFDCDRRAILAMQGEFQVSFNFDETVILQSGYERKKPKRSNGYETVILLEDNGKHISLQHILVSNSGEIVKHWRQDWVYESPAHWHYVGNQRFEQHTRNADKTPGTWTQLVYQVNDAPRYSGSGRWNHKYGVSTWTSERSWRPLPRREYTTRSDYQLLNGENRHTITPQGWTHEQDNTKVARSAENTDTVLVREFGFNEYRRITGYDFSPALTYWQSTAPFWAMVRTHWNERLTNNTIELAFPDGDNTLIKKVFRLADTYQKKQQIDVQRKALINLFRQYVITSPSTPTNDITSPSQLNTKEALTLKQ